MAEAKTKTQTKVEAKTEEVKTASKAETSQSKPTASKAPDAHSARRSNPRKKQGGQRKERGPRRGNSDSLDKKIVSIRRVARTYSGGKRLRLSVLVVVGDKKGRVGAGLGKGIDVRSAEEKAYNTAKKNMVKINLRGGTITHEITHKYGAARVFMKPAAPGTGVIAGGAMRSVLELVGVKNILTKVMGTNNQISNVYATIEALQSLKVHKKRNVK